jgi:hypothetical protein
MKPRVLSLIALAAALAAGTALAAPGENGMRTTFKKGETGWVGRVGPNGTGITYVEEKFGSPRPSLRTQYDDFLKNGLRWYNDGHGFTGDYGVVPSFTFGVDVDTLSLVEGQSQTTRDLMVWFLDYQNPPEGYEAISVGVKIGTLQAGTGWQHWVATVADTASTELPEGWIGTGATDPNTGGSILPPGRTFAEVMHHVDEIAIQTVRQSNIFALDYFDVAIDNPSVIANCPGGAKVRPTADVPPGAKKGSPFSPC